MLEPWILSAQLALVAALGNTVERHDALGPPADPPPPPAHPSGDGVLDRFAARYGFVGGDAERTALRAAIDAVVGHMNIFVRGIARDKLRATNRVPSSLVVRRDGDRVTISLDDRTYAADLDAPPVTVRGSTGDALQLTHRLEGRRLVQAFEGERGSRINTFWLEGDVLRLDVLVRSPRLPKDLRYRLSFGKQS